MRIHLELLQLLGETASHYAFYLTGRKTGNVAKSSELSAECWQCQATLDEMAEQNKQKTMKTGVRLE